MQTPVIISKADFEGEIDISDNTAWRRMEGHIRKAQDFDLRDLMTDKFYYYFMSFFNDAGVLNPLAPEAIRNLYLGGVYSLDTPTPYNGLAESDPNEFTFTPSVPEYQYPGIKPVLVYFAGSRFTRLQDVHNTPTGIMQKINEFSERVSQSSKTFIANEHANQAVAYWEMNLTYLRHSKIDYPQFFGDDCGCESAAPLARPRMYSIGGNDSNISRHGRR